MDLDDIISLAEAGTDLGISPETLRTQIRRGRFRARCVGKTWITTRQEVERYRFESLGQVGRPAHASVATGRGVAHDATVRVSQPGAAVPARPSVPDDAKSAGAAVSDD